MKRVLRLILAHIPTKLPVGIKEFSEWANDIIDLAGKFADEDSMKWTLATMIIHSDAKHGALPKSYFIARLRKAAANQVASQVFQDIKAKQAEEQAAAELKQAEDTALTTEKQAENEHGEEQQAV